MTTVYIDQVFVLNVLVDYLLLLATAQISGMPLQRRRLGVCAAGGGLYAAAVFLPKLAVLRYPVLRFLVGGAIALSAFWPLQRRWHMVLLFYLLSGTLGGILLAVGLALGSAELLLHRLYLARISWSLLLGTAAALYLMLRLFFWQAARHGRGELMQVHISVGGRTGTLPALHDTGNTLRDPVSGQPVLVAEAASLEPYWDRETAEIIRGAGTAETAIAALHRRGRGVGFTLLPFRSVGVASGLLLAVRSDYVKVGRATYSRAWIALSRGPVSDGGAYCALWGGVKRGESYGSTAADAASMDPEAQQAG